MRIIVIHSETGDTLCAVVRTEELDMMGIKYTEVLPNYSLSDIIRCNPDLKEDLDLLLDTCFEKDMVGL